MTTPPTRPTTSLAVRSRRGSRAPRSTAPPVPRPVRPRRRHHLRGLRRRLRFAPSVSGVPPVELTDPEVARSDIARRYVDPEREEYAADPLELKCPRFRGHQTPFGGRGVRDAEISSAIPA